MEQLSRIVCHVAPIAGRSLKRIGAAKEQARNTWQQVSHGIAVDSVLDSQEPRP